MRRWPMARLGELATIQNGFAFKSELFNKAGRGMPLIRIRDLRNNETCTFYSGDYRPEFLVRPGDYLIGMDGDFECHVWKGQTGLLNQRVCKVQSKNGLLDTAYLYSTLQGILRLIHQNTAYATVKHISSKQIAAIEFPLPPLDEQRRIVDLLNRAAGIRRLREQALATARATIPALFLQTFGDPATNPKGWPMVQLGNVISFGPQNGLYRPASDYGSGTRILRIDSFDNGQITDQETLRRLRIDQDTIDRFLLVPGDIVINRVNSPPQLGKSTLIPSLSEPTVFESNMMRLRLDVQRAAATVVATMLELPMVRRSLTRNAKHAINQSSINQQDVTGLSFPLPPLDLQHRFAERLAELHGIIGQQETALAKAHILERSLMARLLD